MQNFYKFCIFRSTVDAEMKQISAMGKGKKQAQPISTEEEEILWQLGLLGDHSAQALVDTMVFQMGLFFALRSGQEHCRLRHGNSQVRLFEPPGGRSYLLYQQEDMSKTNQGGIKHMKKSPKEVIQYANQNDPLRCFVWLYKEYNRRHPIDRPDSAFYLTALKVPKGEVWFSKTPLGHNTLQNTIPCLMKAAGYEGQYTNHSLRV